MHTLLLTPLSADTLSGMFGATAWNTSVIVSIHTVVYYIHPTYTPTVDTVALIMDCTYH